MDMHLRPTYDEMLTKFGAQGKIRAPDREGITAVESFELGFLRDPMNSLAEAQKDKDERAWHKMMVKALATETERPQHALERAAQEAAQQADGGAQTPPPEPEDRDDEPDVGGFLWRGAAGTARLTGRVARAGLSSIFGGWGELPQDEGEESVPAGQSLVPQHIQDPVGGGVSKSKKRQRERQR